jgi:hypothetical protein
MSRSVHSGNVVQDVDRISISLKAGYMERCCNENLQVFIR